MSRYVSGKIRLAVAERAEYRCEYCRRLQSDSFIKFQIEHIISLKQDGETVLKNLFLHRQLCFQNHHTCIDLKL